MANNRIKNLLSAALIVSTAALTGCGGEERQAEYLARAQSFYQEGNLDKARVEVKNVLQINPNNADARYYLGLISEADKDYRGAFQNYNAAIENDPQHVSALNKVTEFYMASKDIDNALEKANVVLAIDSKNADALANLAIIYATQEKPDEAKLKAQEALSIDPGHVQATSVLAALYAKDNPDLAMDVITRGIANQSKNESLKVLKLRLLISQKKADEAVALYKELIAEYPDKLFYTAQLVNFYLQDEALTESVRKDRAEKLLVDLVAEKPDEEEPKLWLAEFVLKSRGLESGKELLKKFVSESPKLEKSRDLLAGLYVDAKEYDAAKSLFQPLIDEDPTGVRAITARNKLVTIALRQDERDVADMLLAEIFALDAENSSALLTRARLNLIDGNSEDAIPDLRIVLKNDPESKEALALLARAYEVNGSADLALDSYQRLLALQPDNVNAMVGAAKIKIAKNQNEEALKLMEAAAKVNAANPEVGQLLSDLYSRDQRWDDALSASAQLIENENTKALGHYLQGRIYLRNKDYDSALKSLKTSLELEPTAIETLGAISAAYSALEQMEKALEFVKDHLAKYPGQVHARELLAELYARTRDTDKAIEICQSIIREYPDRVSTYTLLARLYAATGSVDKLESMYLSAISKNPQQSILRAALAEVYQATGKSDKAIEQYEQTLKITPKSLVARNNLASLLLDRDDKPATIQRVAELTGELAATENPAFLDTAGWAQYKLGNYAQAVSLLGAAVERGGKGAVYQYHLGMAYFKSNLLQQAKEHLSLALKDETAIFTGREEAEQTLQSL